MNNQPMKATDFKEGDVVLVTSAGWGLVLENLNKYVELVEYQPCVDRWTVKGYDCDLVKHDADYGVDVESFGENPMILLNTKEEAAKATLILEEHPLESYPSKGAIKSDGGSSKYYDIEIPEHYLQMIKDSGVMKVEYLIHILFDNDFDFGCAFKALVRAKGITDGAGKEGNTLKYELNKISYYSDKIEEKYDWSQKC